MITTNNPNRQDAKPLSIQQLEYITAVISMHLRNSTIPKSSDDISVLQRLIDNYQNLQHFYDVVGGWEGISEMHNRLNKQLSALKQVKNAIVNGKQNGDTYTQTFGAAFVEYLEIATKPPKTK